MARLPLPTMTLRVSCLALLLASCGGGDEPLQMTEAESSYSPADPRSREAAFAYPPSRPASATEGSSPASTDLAVAPPLDMTDSRYRDDMSPASEASDESFSQQAAMTDVRFYAAERSGQAQDTPN